MADLVIRQLVAVGLNPSEITRTIGELSGCQRTIYRKVAKLSASPLDGSFEDEL